MHHSCAPDIRHLAKGDAFVAAGYRASKSFLTVIDSGRGSAFAAVDEDGVVWKRKDESRQQLESEDGRRIWPVWTLPLPPSGREEAIAYIDVLEASKGYDSPVLLHVTGVDERHARARLVFPAVDGEAAQKSSFADDPDEVFHPLQENTLPLSWTRHGNVAVTDQEILVAADELPEGAAPGSMVAASFFRCEIEDGAPVMRFGKARKALVGMAEDAAEAARFVPMRLPEPGTMMGHASCPAFADPYEYAGEFAKAVARTEPDEALVLWVPRDDGDGTDCRVLGTTGYVFFVTDAPEDQFYGEDVGPGLWLFRRARFWSYESYEGERDWGIEGDWQPATPDDGVRFGFDRESLSGEIRDCLADSGIDAPEGDLAAEWCAKAAEAAAREAAERDGAALQA